MCGEYAVNLMGSAVVTVHTDQAQPVHYFIGLSGQVLLPDQDHRLHPHLCHFSFNHATTNLYLIDSYKEGGIWIYLASQEDKQ